jgi:hypothetical protein
MPRQHSSAAIREAQSLLLKTLGYESEQKRRRHGFPPPVVTEAEASKLASGEGLKLLRQVGRRVDGFLRERKDQSDALLSVVRLREFGVLPKHLPVLPSARMLVRVCSRGSAASAKEANLVLRVLKNPELVGLLSENAEVLGRALDGWNSTAPTQRTKRPMPNPSVKGTSTSGLRPLAAAPYLER